MLNERDKDTRRGLAGAGSRSLSFNAVASRLLGALDSFEEGSVPHFVDGIKSIHEGGFVTILSAEQWC